MKRKKHLHWMIINIIGQGWEKYRDLPYTTHVPVASRSIICLLKLKTGANNNWSARHWQIAIFCDNRVQSLFYHSKTESVFLMNILWKQSNLSFPCKSDHKKEKSVVHLRMSRPLFVGSYLQVTSWALSQWKENKYFTLSAINLTPKWLWSSARFSSNFPDLSLSIKKRTSI